MSFSRRVRREGKPDIEINGMLLHSITPEDTADYLAAKWTKLEIWDTGDGNWVVVKERSDSVHDVVGETLTIFALPLSALDDFEPADPDEPRMRREAMKFFEWSWLAKDLAANLGWDVTEKVGA